MLQKLLELLGAEWNTDPSWAEYVESLTPVIEAIAAKYTQDEDLRQDVVQDSKLVLLHKFPEDARGYERYVAGDIGEEEWQAMLRGFCLTVCRNTILSTLNSYSGGNMYVGRTRMVTVTDENGGIRREKRTTPARFISLDALDEDGLQITDAGELTWPVVKRTDNHETND